MMRMISTTTTTIMSMSRKRKRRKVMKVTELSGFIPFQNYKVKKGLPY